VTFLEHLQRHIEDPLTVIWDGAPIHRSKVVKKWLGQQEPGAIELVRLPGLPEVLQAFWSHAGY
jgi:hypothetical protein